MTQQLTLPDGSVVHRLANRSRPAGQHTNYSAPADIDVVRTIAIEYIQMPELALTDVAMRLDVSALLTDAQRQQIVESQARESRDMPPPR